MLNSKQLFGLLWACVNISFCFGHGVKRLDLQLMGHVSNRFKTFYHYQLYFDGPSFIGSLKMVGGIFKYNITTSAFMMNCIPPRLI